MYKNLIYLGNNYSIKSINWDKTKTQNKLKRQVTQSDSLYKDHILLSSSYRHQAHILKAYLNHLVFQVHNKLETSEECGYATRGNHLAAT
jgi:hypothetical protein